MSLVKKYFLSTIFVGSLIFTVSAQAQSDINNRKSCNKRLFLPLKLPTNNRTNSRHHIIPYTSLDSFYNTSIDIINSSANIPESTILRQHIEHVVRNITNRYNMIEHGQVNHTDSIERALNSSLSEVLANNTVRDSVRAVLAWNPGNIFIGPSPQNRSDDPGNRFEANATYIINNDEYSRNISTVAQLIENFNNNTYNSRNLENITRIVRILNRIAEHDPFRFEQDQWERTNITSEYKWNIRNHKRDELRRRRDNGFTTQIEAPPIDAKFKASSITEQMPYCLIPRLNKDIKENIFF